jgi:hypothetical protein
LFAHAKLSADASESKKEMNSLITDYNLVGKIFHNYGK